MPPCCLCRVYCLVHCLVRRRSSTPFMYVYRGGSRSRRKNKKQAILGSLAGQPVWQGNAHHPSSPHIVPSARLGRTEVCYVTEQEPLHIPYEAIQSAEAQARSNKNINKQPGCQAARVPRPMGFVSPAAFSPECHVSFPVWMQQMIRSGRTSACSRIQN